MNINSKCWENFKGFIKDYYDQTLEQDKDFKVDLAGSVYLINMSSENYEVLFDMAYDSWLTALEEKCL